MILPRREFLKILGVGAGAAGLAGCDTRWSVPSRLVELALQGPGLETSRQTVCGLCESGCGLTARLVDGLPVALKGNRRHPLNRGGICPVGQAGLEVLYAPGRLTTPLRRAPDGSHHPTSWEEALSAISERLADLRQRGAASRAAFLSGCPDGLSNDLIRHFSRALGCPNFARLGGQSPAAYTLSQGLESAPAYDLANADLVLSFGLDLFEDGPAPLNAVAALIGDRETADRATLLHVGTRLSPSAAKAESYLPIRPGTHAAAALGVAHVLVREGRIDRRFIEDHTFGYEDWTDASGRRRLGFRRLLLERYYPERAAQLCGSEPRKIIAAARRLARAARPVALVGGEALTGSNATWTGWAVHALNALLGAFDRSGGVVLRTPIPFSPLPATPDPEGAGLFAPAPGGAGFGTDPVTAISEAAGELEILMLVHANPVYSSPAGGPLQQALEEIDLVVACASFLDESAAQADLILPAPVFLESWQQSIAPSTVAASILGLGAPVIEPLYDSRDPGEILLELARSLGGDVARAVPWPDFPAYLEARFTALVASGQGAAFSSPFEESWVEFLERRGWRFLEEREVGAFRRHVADEGGWWNPVHLEGDWRRHFPTPSGRFEFFSSALEERLRRLGDPDDSDEAALAHGAARLGLAADGDEACLPHFEAPRWEGTGELELALFRPITARGDLGVVSPMLLEMYGHSVLSGWETWAEMSPQTAHELDLEDGDRVSLESERGSIEVVVRIRPGSQPGVVHVPLGLGRHAQLGLAGGIGANPVATLAQVTDPIAGTLASTCTRVRARLLERRRHGGPPPMDGGHS